MNTAGDPVLVIYVTAGKKTYIDFERICQTQATGILSNQGWITLYIPETDYVHTVQQHTCMRLDALVWPTPEQRYVLCHGLVSLVQLPIEDEFSDKKWITARQPDGDLRIFRVGQDTNFAILDYEIFSDLVLSRLDQS